MMKAALRIQDGCLARFNLGVLLQEHTSSHGMAVTQFRAALRMHATETNGAGTEKNHVVDMVDIKARLARVLDAGGDLPEALSVLGEAVQDLELRSSRLQTHLFNAHPPWWGRPLTTIRARTCVLVSPVTAAPQASCQCLLLVDRCQDMSVCDYACPLAYAKT